MKCSLITNIFERMKARKSKFSEQLGMRFIDVHGGSFSIGLTPDQVEETWPEWKEKSWFTLKNEMSPHMVTVNSFLMLSTPVTQSQYERIMGMNPSVSLFGIWPRLPVNNVSWYDTIVFCNMLSIEEDLVPVYNIGNTCDPKQWGEVPQKKNDSWDSVDADWSANGYRLPTEAEWEYAARGGSLNTSQKTSYAGSNNINAVAWYDWNSGGKPQAVATKAPNQLGLYDMSGNIFEWCWDWYDCYSTSEQINPRGPNSGSERVGRGGSAHHEAKSSRVDFRFRLTPSYHISYFGFRIVRNCILV